MHTVTMTSKGQLTVPKELRNALDLHPGARFQAFVDDDGRLVLVPQTHEPEELFEGRPRVERALSIDDMDAAIARALR